MIYVIILLVLGIIFEWISILSNKPSTMIKFGVIGVSSLITAFALLILSKL